MRTICRSSEEGAVTVTRREVIVGAAAAACAFVAGPVLSVRAVSRARPVVCVHMDLPYVDSSGAGEPYVAGGVRTVDGDAVFARFGFV